MKQVKISRFQPLDYACTEAINTLCTNLTFAGADVKKIMVTSCQASEGKSFLSMNIMRTLADLGKNIVHVDTDMRRSMVKSRYGLQFESKNELGLAHYLAGMAKLEDVIYKTEIDGAYMIPIGHEVSNSLSLLTSGSFSALLDQLAEKFDYVIVDAPPVGVIIDAAEIAKSCDGVVLAIHYNRISRRELNEVKMQIERMGCPIIGAVLNSVTFDSYASKKYYNRSYYSHYNSGYYKPGKDAVRSKNLTAGKSNSDR